METPVSECTAASRQRLARPGRRGLDLDPVERESFHLLLQGGEVLGDARRAEQLRQRAGVVAAEREA